MLIIEGPDLAGKTTLAKALCERPLLRDAGYVYQHLSRLPSGFQAVQYLQMAAPMTVRDRFHMSEPCYSYARGDKPRLTLEEYRYVDGALRSLGAVTVVVLPSEELIAERYVTRAVLEMYPLDKVLRAREAFENMVTGRPICGRQWDPDFDLVVRCDNTLPFPDEGVQRAILDLYATRQSALSRFSKRRLFIGREHDRPTEF